MAIVLVRNAYEDPWYSVHGEYIRCGDLVILDSMGSNHSCAETGISPDIVVKRCGDDDLYLYKASLSCFDYVGSTK